MGEALTPECGPHCGTKDKVTGHCDICHTIKRSALHEMEEHENLQRARNEWARGGANDRTSG